MKRAMVVSLIGRPNVGKSTIFNRLMKKQFKSITHDLPGVTRDRHYSICTFDEVPSVDPQDVILVDTGGFYPEKMDIDESIKRRNNYEPFFNIMQDQARIAIEESDLVLFVVDIREGLLPFDQMICQYLRTQKKKFWILVNKYDSDKQMGEEADFYSLGLEEDQLQLISAEHGLGCILIREKIQIEANTFSKRGLTDETVQKGVTPINDVVGAVAIIGAPNVGKSTLLNRLIGANRALVSNIAGTTVDPIEAYINLDFGDDVETLNAVEDQFRKKNTDLIDQYTDYLKFEKEARDSGFYSPEDEADDEDIEEDIVLVEAAETLRELESQNDLFSMESIEEKIFSDEIEEKEEVTENPKVNPWRSIKLVDTAGIRKLKSVEGFIEEQSVYRSLKAITESDVVVFMIDATKGITHQDRRLIDITLEKGKSIILTMNKCDLIRETLEDKRKKKEWLLDLRATVPWLDYCELITISAKNGTDLGGLRNAIKRTLLIRSTKVSTPKLNKLVKFLVDKNPISVKSFGGKRFKVKYSSMIKANPPTFLMFSNRSQGIPEHYRKYLVKSIRNEFKLVNSPVHLIFRTRSEIASRIKRATVNSEKNI